MEHSLDQQQIPLHCAEDLVRMRQIVREWTSCLGFTLVDQTKVVTAASELARNTIDYGGGGCVEMTVLCSGTRRGCRLRFSDSGPGIVDLQAALADGYTSRGGLGLGLGGARRLCDEFEIESHPGVGTRVTITKWKPS